MQVAGNNTIYANRNAYDGAAHDWWQFTDDGTVLQFAIWESCSDTPARWYAVPSNVTLPWGPNDYINVLAIPPV